MRARKLISKILLSLVLAVYAAGIGSIAAYGQSPTPTPTPAAKKQSFSEQLARLAIEAQKWLPHLMYEVEGPLLPFFVKVAQIIGLAIVMTAFLKLLQQHSGASKSLIWWFGRVAFFAAMISLTSAAIDFGEDMGNAIAYGNDRKASFLDQLRSGAMESFNDSFKKFTDGTFTVHVNGEDIPVNPNPDKQNPAYALVGVLYSRESKLEDVTNKLDISSWSMSSLFSFLSVCRYFLDFVDLLVILLRPFLLIAVRLAAPFMMALAIDRDYAKQSTYKFIWGCVVLLLAWPVVTQVMRFVAYSAGNMAIGDTDPLYIWDRSTMTALADQTSKPEYRVIILGLTMFGAGVGVLYAHWIAYKFVNGQMFEGMANLVTQLQGAGLATGIGTVSAAAGQAVMKQAEQMQVQGAADASAVQVEGRRDAANLSAKGNEVAGMAAAQGSRIMGLASIEAQRTGGVMMAQSAAQFGRDQTGALVAREGRDTNIGRGQSIGMADAQRGSDSIRIAGESKAQKKDAWLNDGFGSVPIVGRPIGHGIIDGFGESAITTRNRTQNEAGEAFRLSSINITNNTAGQQIASQQQYGQDMTGAYNAKETRDVTAANTQAGIAAGGVNAGTSVIMGGISSKHSYDVRANQTEYNAGMKAMEISRDAGMNVSELRSVGALISQFGQVLAAQTTQIYREVRF